MIASPGLAPVAVDRGEYRIAAATAGEEGDPAVLAVHGFASSLRATWVDTGWIAALLGAHLRVVAVDLRSHGSSDRSRDTNDHTLSALVDDIAAVVAQFCPTGFHYLGYSLGARLGWEYAGRRDERLLSLSLGGFGELDPFAAADIDALCRHFSEGTALLEGRDAVLAGAITASPDNDPEALLSVLAGVEASVPGTVIPAVPTLIVNGAADDLAAGGERIAAQVAQGSYVSLPGRTHRNAVSARSFKQAVIAHITAMVR